VVMQLSDIVLEEGVSSSLKIHFLSHCTTWCHKPGKQNVKQKDFEKCECVYEWFF